MPADFSSLSFCRVRPVAALAHSTSTSGRDFKRRPSCPFWVGASFFGGIGLHGSIARFISSLVYQGRRAAIA